MENWLDLEQRISELEEKVNKIQWKDSIKDIKTTDLLKELSGREGVEKLVVGPYQGHGLREKYACRKILEGVRGKSYSGVVLFIED